VELEAAKAGHKGQGVAEEVAAESWEDMESGSQDGVAKAIIILQHESEEQNSVIILALVTDCGKEWPSDLSWEKLPLVAQDH